MAKMDVFGMPVIVSKHSACAFFNMLLVKTAD
jgi:hypothetical protein